MLLVFVLNQCPSNEIPGFSHLWVHNTISPPPKELVTLPLRDKIIQTILIYEIYYYFITPVQIFSYIQ